MHDFILRELKNTDMETELNRIGFDRSYVHKAVEKFDYKNIKIYSLTPAQANIIKQTAISVGADCATHREVITGKIEKSDCILGASSSQIKKIAEKLKFQPFKLKELGQKLLAGCKTEHRVKLAGILNLTENSFSDGGLYNDFEKAKEHLLQMINEGADIIDIGAESTKPYSSEVPVKNQLEKLLPVIDFAGDKIKLSIDTRSSVVAEECIKAGAQIINDVSGFDYDEKMPDVIAKYNVPVIIQHSKGTPENMQNSPKYNDLMEEIFLDLKNKINIARSKGVEKIITDPGIGFGKTQKDNFEIIKRVDELHSLGCPIMLGISRKSLLGMSNEDNYVKDIYTLALNAVAIEHRVDYLRVHNVILHKKLLDLLENFEK
ncbi:MAG TPA: dihydropteroate synthase [Candidatus Stercorousia faecigallinarum]|nr:dihydropteroate synthase [Candidatus Stercorousia faecigallinarum]